MNEKIRELIDFLNSHTKLYDEGCPTISDQEWDNKYFELVKLEKDTGIVYPDSPTQSISYEARENGLEKVEHNHLMLSLDKTKSVEEVDQFLHGQEYIAMCKMDGLTCSLRYYNGLLVGAETRGNGVIGEDILHNARVIKNIPRSISYKGELIVDGEIICTYKNFEKWSEEYKNPRNFASGSIRLLKSEECAARDLSFVAWDMIKGPKTSINSFRLNLLYLWELGFTTVPEIKDETMSTSDKIDYLKSVAEDLYYPIDGIVFKFDDIEYGKSLGSTEHHFKNAIAYKFYDESYESYLLGITYDTSRRGVLTPVAVFEPIDIDGTSVNRASLSNISTLYDTLGATPYQGQRVCVSKRNQIIPYIESADKCDNYDGDKLITLPKKCNCGGETELVKSESGTVTLVCTNPACPFKLINRLDHFVGKKGLDIKGLSVATLEKLIDNDWVKSLGSIFELNQYRSQWIKLPGFGPTSVDKILNAIEAARTTTLEKFICSLGIPLIGNGVSKEIVKYYPTYEEFRNAINSRFDFSIYEGFAESKTEALWNFDYTEADEVYKYLSIPKVEIKESASDSLAGVSVCITGKLIHYKNRAALQTEIEAAGGKVVSSVSAKTNYLINNDNTSTSSKNVTAQKLGIPVLTEEEFINKFLG
jgi:DNA ligase (NAD+)